MVKFFTKFKEGQVSNIPLKISDCYAICLNLSIPFLKSGVSANTPSFHITSPMAMGLIIGGTNNTNFVNY
ncbi:hypothetical protein NC651_038807 [Populus alba x Populus x berolinensis]|nr:hypothetical protein NC651_038807 [Populus alba x Populus x berolinensis]